MGDLEKLARKRDQLRRGQVRDRGKVKDLRSAIEALQKGLARRGRRIKHIAQRIRHLRRQEVHQSAKGREFLIAQEGIVLHTYNDSAGHCTACVGHLVSMASCSGQRNFTRAECERMLAADVHPCEAAVKNAIHVPLKQHEKDALISFAFNVGTNGFTTSTLVRRINAKASGAEIREAFLMWRFPPEIVGRRQREVELYLNGNYG
jgi:lysozyme